MTEWKDQVAACSSEAQALIQCVEDDLTRNRDKLGIAIGQIRSLTAEANKLKAGIQAVLNEVAVVAGIDALERVTKAALDAVSDSQDLGEKMADEYIEAETEHMADRTTVEDRG